MKFLAISALAIVTLAMAGGCGKSPPPAQSLSAVLAANSAKLMAIPGVVGVYEGLMSDDKTPCLKVMIKDPRAIVQIPGTIGGYAVKIEHSGEIRPK